jgi:hypothetical protein
MDNRQQRETERNVRSDVFLTENTADFAANAVATAKIAALTTQSAKVEATRQKQMAGDGAIRQDYDVYKDAFDVLLDEMRSVRDFANSIGREVPGLEKKFRLPRGGGKGAIITAANVFADDAAEHKQMFLDYGMDKEFIEHLREKAAAAQDALNKATGTTGEKVGATDALEADVQAASDTVESIDPIVQRVYRDNPTKLAAWTYASHLERHTPKPRLPIPPVA